jgi:hypothetical protein
MKKSKFTESQNGKDLGRAVIGQVGKRHLLRARH